MLMVPIKVLLAAVVAVGVALHYIEQRQHPNTTQLASTTALHIPKASTVHHGKLELSIAFHSGKLAFNIMVGN